MRNRCQCFRVAIKPGTEDDDQAADNEAKDSHDDQPEDACRNGSPRGLYRKLGGGTVRCAEASSSTPMAGRAKANRLARLLITSGVNTHCQPPKGPVNAGWPK